MKMKRRLLGILLSLALTLGLMAGMSLTAYAVGEYNLWVGGKRVTSENWFDDGWSYDSSNMILELKGGEVTANGRDRGLFSDGNLIISGGKVTANGQSCIYASKEFAISGGTVTAIGTVNATPNLGIVQSRREELPQSGLTTSQLPRSGSHRPENCT